MQRITPFLWFDSQADEAARYYAAIFKSSKILSISDAEKRNRVMQAMFKMVKLDIETLKNA